MIGKIPQIRQPRFRSPFYQPHSPNNEMRFNPRLLGLPACLTFLIALRTSAISDERSPAQWLNERSHGEASLRENLRRDTSFKKQTQVRGNIVGVKKMSDDPSEKFFPEYWVFEEDLTRSTIPEVLLNPPLRARDEAEESRLLSNASAEIFFKPPFALHTDDESAYQDLKARGSLAGRGAVAALAALSKRDFNCPSGTFSCSGIGAPNACCATGEKCFNITDTGLGTVGCCPDGVNCGGTISTCESNYTPCVAGGQNYEHGGCCIPNYICAGVGCVINPTLIVTVVITQTFTAFPSQSTIQTSTVLSTITPTTSTLTDTALQTTLVCATDMHACPVNLGGGCCTSGFTCASSSSCIPPSGFTFSSVATTSSAGVAPVRPTTDSSTSISTSTDTGSCPTGFYACSAFYRGGCCRTDRDCHTYSCPPTSSTTIVSGTETIVVPTGAAATVATPAGSCAGGWSTCSASVGGNCCPSGWECGTASCTSISPSQTEVLQKGSPQKSMAGLRVRAGIGALGGMSIIVFLLI